MRILFLALSFLCLLAAGVAADTITSLPGGGLWNDAATWDLGVVPGEYDDVVITPYRVSVDGDAICLSLYVLNTAILEGEQSTPDNELTVLGDVLLDGEFADSSYPFIIRIGGDIDNRGIWTNHTTIITGEGVHDIAMDTIVPFASKLVLDEEATGSLYATTPLLNSNDIRLNGGSLTLAPGSDLTFMWGYLDGGEIFCNGNTIDMGTDTVLQYLNLDQAVLAGRLRCGHLVSATGGLTNMGEMSNFSSQGNSAATVEGGFVNHGTVRNDNYGFQLFISGDVANHGLMTQSTLFLDGVGEQHLSQGPDRQFDCQIYLPEFQGGTLIADTDLTFNDILNLGSGELILTEGATVKFLNYGYLVDGFLTADGNDLIMEGNSFVRDLSVSDAVLRGVVKVEDVTTFTGGVLVADILENRQYFPSTARVNGDLLNEGLIRDQNHPFTIRITGDLGNSSFMTNTLVVLDGADDQAVGTGDGIGVGEMRLESGLSGGGYQWYRDGQMLSGETNAALSFFAGIGYAEFGRYHCEVSGGQISRNITIGEFIDPTGVDEFTPVAQLGRSYPNPFNPKTTFTFSLDRSAHARLCVYDQGGRRVAELVNRNLPAGAHAVEWRPTNLSSGVYLYRLDVAGQVQTGKTVLVK
ncbi:MAG: T9SS type A sorting domain-containing protein [bacterium]|nr:T9SS type A sorting domain-containing protein [bacterium]